MVQKNIVTTHRAPWWVHSAIIVPATATSNASKSQITQHHVPKMRPTRIMKVRIDTYIQIFVQIYNVWANHRPLSTHASIKKYFHIIFLLVLILVFVTAPFVCVFLSVLFLLSSTFSLIFKFSIFAASLHIRITSSRSHEHSTHWNKQKLPTNQTRLNQPFAHRLVATPGQNPGGGAHRWTGDVGRRWNRAKQIQ